MDVARQLDGYIRVSQTLGRGGESFQSPLLQREAIERWARTHAVTIAAAANREASSGRCGMNGRFTSHLLTEWGGAACHVPVRAPASVVQRAESSVRTLVSS